jgi:hypothetical protein
VKPEARFLATLWQPKVIATWAWRGLQFATECIQVESTFCLPNQLAKSKRRQRLVEHEAMLAAPQEHAMIVRAIDQFAKPLSVDIAKVRASLSLLDSIDTEAVELLKNKPVTAMAFKLFSKAKAIRQVRRVRQQPK